MSPLLIVAIAAFVGVAALVGGVAANSRLRDRVEQEARQIGATTHIPALDLCGDNAAMIAAAGYHQLVGGKVSSLKDDVYSRVPRA